MKYCNEKGFTLIELMVAMAIVGILATIAIPSYSNYVIRASRQAAQTELLVFASLQEKIYLNSSRYAPSVTATYDGSFNGGLNRASGRTNDGFYDLSLSVGVDQSYILTASPVAGTRQASDGILSISENGRRVWGSGTW